MIEKFFNIRYVFGKDNVWAAIDKVIDEGGKGFVVVADGVVVNTAQRSADYRKCLGESLFAMCDSGWIPLYIHKIYGDFANEGSKGSKVLPDGQAAKPEQEVSKVSDGKHYVQYCGPQIFPDFIERRKHRMFFMGTDQRTLDGLKRTMMKVNPDLEGMTFYELPFLSVEEFDYEGIARMVEEDGADIIWVALGAPKQCFFMQRLLPHLKKGVMLGVGAAFKFYSGTAEKRCPKWMHDMHLEFVYRIMQDPKKQLNRCWWIVKMLPSMIREERGKKKAADNVMKAMKEYIAVINDNDNKGSLRKVHKASRKVLEAVYEYDESKCRDKINLYWLQVVESVLDALDATLTKNKQDEHLKQALRQYAQSLVDLIDKNAAECSSIIVKASTLGIE